MTLANATEELAPLVKQLDTLRKQFKSHTNTMTDYRAKMQEWLTVPTPGWGHDTPPGPQGQPSQTVAPGGSTHMTAPQPGNLLYMLVSLYIFGIKMGDGGLENVVTPAFFW